MEISVKDFIPPVILKLWPSRSKPQLYTNTKGENISADSILVQNKELKDKYKGKRCFIVGAGGSIKMQDLKVLKNEVVFGLNEFFLHPDYKEIAPKYLVFSGFGIHNVPTEKQILWYQDYEKRIEGISTPLINICDYNYLAKNGLLMRSGVKFMRYENNYDLIMEQGIDAAGNLYASQGVGAMAIQIAVYMGFSEIVLLGYDHDWLLRMFDNQPTHFFDHNSSIIYKGHREVEGITVLYQLQSMTKLFSNYVQIKKYTDSKHINILNATAGGMLDVFPRVQFETLFENKRP